MDTDSKALLMPLLSVLQIPFYRLELLTIMKTHSIARSFKLIRGLFVARSALRLTGLEDDANRKLHMKHKPNIAQIYAEFRFKTGDAARRIIKLYSCISCPVHV
jgi:hypothetical protein